jgi:hypothetical protein
MFMIFTKCSISRLFVTSCRLKNGSKMNFATEPTTPTWPVLAGQGENVEDIRGGPEPACQPTLPTHTPSRGGGGMRLVV